MIRSIFILTLLLATKSAIGQEKITTFILVRHAEKANDGTNDPDLEEKGIARANHLVDILGKTSVDAIYSTAFKRTRNTVAPLAKAKGIEVAGYEAFKVEEIEKMLKKHAGGTVVICGHSNNIPWIANLLTGKEQYKDFEDSDYKNFIVVSVLKKGKVSNVTWLTY